MTDPSFDSVWDALENSPAEAANMKARAALMVAIRDVVEGWHLTQGEAAKRLGVTQPRLNDLLRGRIDKFSVDALIILATGAGLAVEWKIGKLLELEPSRAGVEARSAGNANDDDGDPETTSNKAPRLTREEFARISEVEGLRLSDEMTEAFADFDRRNLTAEERRQAIIARFKRDVR
jgi:predicted XRE-type DNA-binding protein